MQIDLLSNMDRTSSMDRSPSLILSVGTEVPAGAFGQVSLLLMPDTPTEAEPVPEKNACAGVGFNCVVAADGGIRPLIVTGRSQILIPASQIEGGLLSVLPETMTDLDLELSPRSSLTYTPGSALWFDPVFTARSDPSASAPR